MRRLLWGVMCLVAVWTIGYVSPTATQSTAAVALRAAMDTETIKGDLRGAIEQYKALADGGDRAIAAQALVRLAGCYEKLGTADARAVYERIVREFGDHTDAVAFARTRLGRSAAGGIATRQILTGPEVEARTAVSPDGRLLSFGDRASGNLSVRDIASGQVRRLTNNPQGALEYAQESAFSPDGGRVAFAWFNKHFRYDLRMVSVTGPSADVEVLFDSEDVAWIAPYDWSPDGKWIAVQIRRKDRSAQIGLVSTADGALRVLKSVDWRGSTRLTFSPDGRYLAYDLPADEGVDQRNLFALATDLSRDVTVINEPADEVLVGWTSDSRDVLFTSDRLGANSLWAISLQTGSPREPRLVKPDIGRPVALGVTRAGALFFGVSTGGIDVLVAPLEPGGLHRPASSGLSRFVGDNRNPDWSPDGKWLAYNSFRRAAGGLFNVLVIRSPETDEVRELRPALESFRFARWAPDGKSFIIQGSDFKGRSGLYRVDADTGRAEFVTTGNGPQWSSDGRKLYFRRNVQRLQLVIERDMATGEERELRRGEERWVGVSPDGRYLVGHPLGGSVLLVAPKEGGAIRELVRLQTPRERLGNIDSIWTPDSQSVVFRKIYETGASELWIVPIAGGAPRKLEIAGKNPGMPVIRPGGREIAVQLENEGRDEIIAMDNVMPAVVASR